MPISISNRSYWNIVKGIGIVLVVVGHTCFTVSNFIYLFHLPLFFFVSGYLYSEKKYGDDPYLHIANRIKSSWIKYVLIYWVIIFLHNFFCENNMTPGIALYTKEEMIAAMAKAVFGIANELMGGTLWFVPASVISVCLLGFIVTISRKVHTVTNNLFFKIFLQFIMIMGFTIIGYYFEKNQIALITNMQASLVVMPFLWVGYLLNNEKLNLEKYLNPFVALGCVIVVYLANTKYSLDLIYGLIYPYVHIVAFCGIYVCLYVAKIIQKFKYSRNLFETFGKASFWIMFIHFPMFKIFDWVYTVQYNDSNFNDYMAIPIAYHQFVPLYLIMGLGLSTLMYVVYVKLREKIKRK